MGSLLVAGVKAAMTAKGLAAIGAGVSVAGAIQESRAVAAEAESAANVAAFNAAIEKREAEAVRQKAGFEQRQQVKRGERIKGALTARVAAAGGLGSPVAADLAAEQVAELELENLLIGLGGEVGAERAESQARLDRLQEKILKKRGRAAGVAGGIRTGATLLTGFETVFGE